MKYLNLKKAIFGAFFLCLSFSAQAVPFAFDNYTSAGTLSYSYSMDGKTWVWVGYLPSSKVPPQGFVNLNFPDGIPPYWKIDAVNGKKILCVDAKNKSTAQNVVVLKDPSYSKKENLLLDVLQKGADNEFTVSIIDLDGEGEYSNVISCIVNN